MPRRTRTSRRGRSAAVAFGIVAILALAVAVTLAVPTIRWRVQIILLAAAGQIPDIEWRDLIAFMLPSSEQPMARLVDTRNPYAVIHNPYTSPADVDAGKLLFRDQCATCHAPDGRGGSAAPALVDREFTHGDSDWALYRTIHYGVPNTAMAPHPLSQRAIWQLTAYIRSLDVPADVEEVDAAATGPEIRAVPYEEIRDLREPASDWLTYSGSYASTRHSVLSQINPGNVNQLAARWIHQFPDNSGVVETSPIVRDGIMFATLPYGRVMALDASNGNTLWTYERKLPADVVLGEAGDVNRGVAILGDKVFVGTGDAHLIALSVRTGKPLWDNAVANYREGYSITAAPLAFRDLVVTGVRTFPGGRAFVVAIDANTGKERWRFFTIPAAGEPGNETWSGDSWRNGGAPTWLTGSYDPELDILYWGVGNPKPDYDTGVRAGDNLYTNSVVALQGATGKLLWHFQFTPADDHDWDANQIPVLANHVVGQRTEKHLLWANRNAFYYLLDRESGRFLRAAPFAHQTWADGIDGNGRPIRNKESLTTHKGIVIYPGNLGATNWWSPSYDAALDLLFVPVMEQGMVFFPAEDSEKGEGSASYSWPTGRGRSWYPAVRALNASTGKVVWEYRGKLRVAGNPIAGVLSTTTGVVFSGDSDAFFALAAQTGLPLWSVKVGGNIAAAPVTYEVNGEQFVAIAAGRDLFAFALPKGRQDNSLPQR